MSRPKLKRPAPGTVLGTLALIVALAGNTGAFAGTGTKITKADIAKGAVTANAIAPGAVRAKALAKNAVHSKALAAGAVNARTLASGAVSSASLSSAAVTSKALAKGAVGPEALAPDAVTASALAPSSVYGGALGPVTTHSTPIADLDEVAHNRDMDRLEHRERRLRSRRTPADRWGCLHQPWQPRSRGDSSPCLSATATRRRHDRSDHQQLRWHRRRRSRGDLPQIRAVRPMPRISSFYGIVIEMYFGDHPPPHFHARYGGETRQDRDRNRRGTCRVSFESCSPTRARMGRRATAMSSKPNWQRAVNNDATGENRATAMTEMIHVD